MIKINGEIFHLWLAVDQHADLLEILVQKRRNERATKPLALAAAPISSKVG